MKYRDNFNHLGEMRQGDFQPWTAADKVILGLFVLTIFILGVI